jgi:hypothetical protein
MIFRESRTSRVTQRVGVGGRAHAGARGPRGRAAGCVVVLVLAGVGVLAPGAGAAQACTNLGVRGRQLHASRLADCRAYVQVTPVQKGGVNPLGFPGSVTASPDGQRVRYYSTTAIEGTPDPESPAPFYVSSRTPCVGVLLCDGSEEPGGKKTEGEWSTLGMLPFNTLYADAYGFSEDLSQALVATEGSKLIEEPAGSGAGKGFQETPREGRSYYLLESSSGIYRLLASMPANAKIWPAGFSANARQLVFETAVQLLPDAREDALNTYEFDLEDPVGHQLSLVGLVPKAGQSSCSAAACETPVGSVAGAGAGGHTSGASPEPTYTQSAISADGSVIIFTAANGEYEGQDGYSGLLYARVDGEETLAVSQGVAHFRAATPNGRYVLYTEEGKLYRYDLESKTRLELAPAGAGVGGTLGVSEEGSTVYFVAAGILAHNTRTTSASGTGTLSDGSDEVSALTSVASGSFFATGQEIEGEGIPPDTTIDALAGETITLSKPATQSGAGVALSAHAEEAASEPSEVNRITNLYEWKEGKTTPTFIAKLTDRPEELGDEGDWRDYLLRSGFLFTQRSSRLTPAGQTLLFSSRRALTGYANDGHQELFRYHTPPHEGEPPSLVCVSCGPPASQASEETYPAGAGEDFHPENEAALTRNLSENGQRVFFQTRNRLLPTEDDSGLTSVYEWEANGEGTCGSETQDGGCLSLISAGGVGE